MTTATITETIRAYLLDAATELERRGLAHEEWFGNGPEDICPVCVNTALALAVTGCIYDGDLGGDDALDNVRFLVAQRIDPARASRRYATGNVRIIMNWTDEYCYVGLEDDPKPVLEWTYSTVDAVALLRDLAGEA